MYEYINSEEEFINCFSNRLYEKIAKETTHNSFYYNVIKFMIKIK